MGKNALNTTLAVVLFAVAALACAPARAEIQVKLPADELGHNNQPVEWWYYSGHLTDDSGGRYGVMASWFSVGYGNLPRSHFVIFHLVDKNGKKFYSGSVVEKEMIGLMKIVLSGLPQDMKEKLPPDLFDMEAIKRHHDFMEEKAIIRKDVLGLKYGDQIFMKTKEESDDWTGWAYKTAIKGRNFGYELALTPKRGPMFVGGEGNVGMYEDQDMYYYSLSRLAAEGVLTIDGETRKVSGTLWYDHQFGSFGKETRPVGWDWFCLQLEDGTDLNLSALRWAETGERLNFLGTIQTADGSQTVIHDLVIEELGKWTSADTGITYPSGWVLRIPSKEMEFRVMPEFPEQEMRTFGPMRAIWEGACTVEGTVAGREVRGDGYTELVGYEAAGK